MIYNIYLSPFQIFQIGTTRGDLQPDGSVELTDIELKYCIGWDNINNIPIIDTDKMILDQNNYVKNELEQAVQTHLDDTAKSYGYDSVISACSYAGEVNPFQTESKKFIAWRGNVWAYVIQVQSDVVANVRTIPTTTELIAELPIYQ